MNCFIVIISLKNIYETKYNKIVSKPAIVIRIIPNDSFVPIVLIQYINPKKNNTPAIIEYLIDILLIILILFNFFEYNRNKVVNTLIIPIDNENNIVIIKNISLSVLYSKLLRRNICPNIKNIVAINIVFNHIRTYILNIYYEYFDFFL
tara:strand:- start:474 stop:920 length:447 start_codon:yes stop_codon:yes gene_type:complete